MIQRPGEPLAALDGYALIWKPSIAVVRILQLGRLLDPPRPKGHVYREQLRWRGTASRTARVRGWAEEAGVVWQGRIPYTRCSCGALTRRVVESDGRWTCVRCGPHLWSHLELRLGDYGCALRLGVHGWPIRERRARLAQQLARRVPKLRSYEELAMAARVGAILEIPMPGRMRRRGRVPRRQYMPGPVRHRLAPLLVPAAIDALLHRDAYLERFGPQRRAA